MEQTQSNGGTEQEQNGGSLLTGNSPEQEAPAQTEGPTYEWPQDKFDKPDWLNEKFWGETPGEALLEGEGATQAQLAHMQKVLANQHKSYDELYKKMRAGKPEPPEQYSTESFAEAVAEDDPALKVFSDTAKEIGLTQEQYETVVSRVLEVTQATAEERGLTEFTQEQEAQITKELGDNTSEIVGTIKKVADNMIQQGDILPEDWDKLAVAAGRDASTLRALYAMVKGNAPHQIEAGAGGTQSSLDTENKISAAADAALDAGDEQEFIRQAAKLLTKG